MDGSIWTGPGERSTAEAESAIATQAARHSTKRVERFIKDYSIPRSGFNATKEEQLGNAECELRNMKSESSTIVHPKRYEPRSPGSVYLPRRPNRPPGRLPTKQCEARPEIIRDSQR